MDNLYAAILPYKVVFSHFLLVLLVLAVVYRKSWGKTIANFLHKYSLAIGLFLALEAIVGSLFYSEIIGYTPCVLCWWQRILLYPMVALFAIAWWAKDRGVFKYAAVLALINTLVAGYHSYVYLGGKSILPCTALGGACSKVYVMAFGYITIPMMSLTISLFILLLAWVNKIHKDENRHA